MPDTTRQLKRQLIRRAGATALASALAFLGFAYAFSPASAASTIPKELNYQARITDAAGIALPDGSLSVKFVIYDQSATGTCLYTARGTCGTPTAKTVTVTNGVFSTLIGDTSAGDNVIPDNLFDSATTYLGIAVGSDAEMTPRKRFAASAYAFDADRLDGLDASSTGGSNSFVPVTDAGGNLRLNHDIIVDNGSYLYVSGAGTLNLGDSSDSVNIANAKIYASSSGNVGVGTTNAPQKLTVAGGGIRLDNSQAFYIRNAADSADLAIFTMDTNNDVRFQNANSFQFDRSVAVNSGFDLQISNGQIITGNGQIRSTVAGGAHTGFAYFTDNNLSGPGSYMFEYSQPAGYRFVQTGYGDVGINTQNPTATLTLAATTTNPTYNLFEVQNSVGSKYFTVSSTNTTVGQDTMGYTLNILGGRAYFSVDGSNVLNLTTNTNGLKMNLAGTNLTVNKDIETDDGALVTRVTGTNTVTGYVPSSGDGYFIAGNFGFGTSTPTARVTVAGTVSPTTNVFEIQNATDSVRYFSVSSTSTNIGSTAGGVRSIANFYAANGTLTGGLESSTAGANELDLKTLNYLGLYATGSPKLEITGSPIQWDTWGAGEPFIFAGDTNFGGAVVFKDVGTGDEVMRVTLADGQKVVIPNGSFGIGTATPDAVATIASTTGTNIFNIENGNKSERYFSVSATSTLIDPSGISGYGVGIGTANASSTLTVSGSAFFKPITDSADAFMIQDSGSVPAFSVDTTNDQATIGKGGLQIRRTDNAGLYGTITYPTTGSITFGSNIQLPTDGIIYDGRSSAINMAFGGGGLTLSNLSWGNLSSSGLKFDQPNISPTLGFYDDKLLDFTGTVIDSATATVRGLYTTLTDNSPSIINTLIGLTADVSGGTNSSAVRYAALLLGGNVGIGWSAPGARLTVAASGTSPTSNIFQVENANDSTRYFTVSSTATVIGSTSSTYAVNVTGTRITGNLTPTADATYDLGDYNLRWKSLWLSGGTANIAYDTSGTSVLQLGWDTTTTPTPKISAPNGYGLVLQSGTSKFIVGGSAPATGCAVDSSGNLSCSGTITSGSSGLQSAYNSSTSPEITLDATRGALTIRDAASTVGNLLELQNNSNSASYLAVSSTNTTIGGSTSYTSTINGLVTINPSGGGSDSALSFTGTPGYQILSTDASTVFNIWNASASSLALRNTGGGAFSLSVVGSAGFTLPSSAVSAIGVNIADANTAQTANEQALYANSNGSFDTTSGLLQNFAGYFEAHATRSAGGNNLQNYGVFADASGAQLNVALETYSGNVILNANSGTTEIGGATTMDSTLNVLGNATLGEANTDMAIVNGILRTQYDASHYIDIAPKNNHDEAMTWTSTGSLYFASYGGNYTRINSTGDIYSTVGARFDGSVGIGAAASSKLTVSGGDVRVDANNVSGVGGILFADGSLYDTSRNGALISGMGAFAGRLLNRNAELLDGTTGYTLYDNAGGGHTTLTSTTDATAPNSSHKILRVAYDGAGTPSSNPSPGYGGFAIIVPECSGTNNSVNGFCYIEGNRYQVRIWAKFPSGYAITFASNSYGTGQAYQWTTGQAGTGNWQEYDAILTVGIGGSLQTTGFWYIDGSPNAAFNADVASVQVTGLDETPSVESSSNLNVGYYQGANLNYGQFLTTKDAYLAVSGGNVGIETTGPIAPIELDSSAGGQTTAALTDAGNRGGMLFVNAGGTAAGSGGAVVFGNSQSHAANSVGMAAIKGYLRDGSNNTNGDLAFSTRGGSADTALTERMRILYNGNVGIGTANPITRLHVQNGSSGISFSPNGRTAAIIEGNNSSGTMLSIIGPATANAVGIFMGSPTNEAPGQLEYDNTTGNMTLCNGGCGAVSSLFFSAAGNFGIGNVTPSAKLTIADTNASPTSNVLQVQNANDSARYLTVSSTSTLMNPGNISGFKVGIGTSIPLTKLQVGIDNVPEPATLGSLTPQVVIMGTKNDTTDDSLLRLIRPTYNGSLYPASVDFKMKSYGSIVCAPCLPHTQLTIGLKQSASYDTGDVVDVMALQDNGNVGIGTTSPGASLEINKTVSVDTANIMGLIIGRTSAAFTPASRTIDLAFKDGPNAGLTAGISSIRDLASSNWNSELAFYTSNDSTPAATTVQGLNERMRIDSSGNVGIGTASPHTALQVNGAISLGTVTMTNSSTGDINNIGRLTFAGTDANAAPRIFDVGSGLKFHSDTNGIQFIDVSSNNLMIVQNGGNVGIGTSAPTARLAVNGVISPTSNILQVANANDSTRYFTVSSSSTQALNDLFVLGNINKGSAADIADIFQVGTIRKNFAPQTDTLGNETASGYDTSWGSYDYPDVITWTTSSQVSPRGVTETVGQVTSTGSSDDYRTTLHTVSTGISDVRGLTFTFSFWAKTASGSSSIGLSLGRYADNDGGGVSCAINSTNWTRCSYTRTFNNTSYADDSEIRAYTNSYSSGVTYYLYGAQIERSSSPTAYQKNTGTSLSSAVGIWSPSVRIGNTAQAPNIVADSNGMTIANSNSSPTTNILEVRNTSGLDGGYTAKYLTVSSTSTHIYGNLTLDGTCTGCGGGSTLQSDYNSSTSPELTLDGTRGALTIRDAGTAVGNLLELQNNSNSKQYLTVSSTSTTIGTQYLDFPDVSTPSTTAILLGGSNNISAIESHDAANGIGINNSGNPNSYINFSYINYLSFTDSGASTAFGSNFFTLAPNSLTTGSGISLTTSSASLNSTNGVLYVANTTSSTSGVLARLQSNSTTGSGLTVRASGNVGVGTASPTGLLTVAGAVSPASNLFQVQNANDSTRYMTVSSTNTVIGSASNTYTVTPNAWIAGNLTPSTDNTYTLGDWNRRWKDVYVGPGSLHIGNGSGDESVMSYDTTAKQLVIRDNGGVSKKIGGVSSVKPLRALNLPACTAVATDYNAGYSFTVKADGYITALGARKQAGTQTVYLYVDTGGGSTAVRSATVTTTGVSGDFVYTDITPYPVTAGSSYVVSVRGNSTYCQNSGLTSMPYQGEGVQIDTSRYVLASNLEPDGIDSNTMYGQADVVYQPSDAGDMRNAFVRVTNDGNLIYDNSLFYDTTGSYLALRNTYNISRSALSLQTSGYTGYTSTDGLQLQMSSLNANLTNYEAGSLAFGTNGSTRMTIDSNGNVGIGTTSTTPRLTVRDGNVSPTTNIFQISNSTDSARYLTVSSTSTYLAGNVGIGTTNPANVLDVYNGATEALLVNGSAHVVINVQQQGSAGLCHASNGAGFSEITDCASNPTSDYMEMYPTDADVEMGYIVAPGATTATTKDGDAIQKLTKTTAAYQQDIIGVVSNPDKAGDFNSVGYNIDGADHPMPIALSGRVKVVVTSENGAIKAGDPITSGARLPGVGMKATQAGRIVGIALSSYDNTDTSATGSVMVFMNGSWFNGADAVSGESTTSGSLTVAQDSLIDFKHSTISNVAAIISSSGNWSVTDDGYLTVTHVTAKTVDAEEFRTVVTDTAQSTGEGSIQAGSSATVIHNGLVKPNSRIFVTFDGNVGSSWWVAEKGDGDFTVHLAAPAPGDVGFTYWIMNIDDQRTPSTPVIDSGSTTQTTDSGSSTPLTDSGSSTPPVDSGTSTSP